MTSRQIKLPDLPPAAELLDFQADRDATLKLIDWFDVQRVRAARVLVVGTGAIGNEVLKNLALLGVGHVYMFDRDTVEISNLSRSVLFRASDRGRLKAEVAARAVTELNADVEARWAVGDLALNLGLGVVRRMDVVIGCLDNREARLMLNRACWKVDRPWVDAGIGQLNGQVRVFRPGHGACYECGISENDYRQIATPCNALASRYAAEGRVPTTPTIASIVAGVQVQETLKLLAPEQWEGRSMAGREFIFNGTVGAASFVELPVRDDCLAHYRIDAEDIVECPRLSAAGTTAAELLSEVRGRLGPSAVVRLNFEMAVEWRCPACGARHPVLQPVRALFREDVHCAGCDRPGYLVTTHTIGGAPDEYNEFFLDRPLAELGVPPLEMLEARGAGQRSLWFELTGDASGGIFNAVPQ
jgi:adenylyltransferase/sulfurtransferase